MHRRLAVILVGIVFIFGVVFRIPSEERTVTVHFSHGQAELVMAVALADAGAANVELAPLEKSVRLVLKKALSQENLTLRKLEGKVVSYQETLDVHEYIPLRMEHGRLNGEAPRLL